MLEVVLGIQFFQDANISSQRVLETCDLSGSSGDIDHPCWTPR
jgi:hypothetical protein